MDGKGRFLDNIFIERLWRTLKYGCVCLHPWETDSMAKAGIRKWMTLCTHQRPHSALGSRPPAGVCWRRNEPTNLDQQVQRAAQFTPDHVQPMGSSSLSRAICSCVRQKRLRIRPPKFVSSSHEGQTASSSLMALEPKRLVALNKRKDDKRS
jgi:putative transposase